jgi:hypothetical protein
MDPTDTGGPGAASEAFLYVAIYALNGEASGTCLGVLGATASSKSKLLGWLKEGGEPRLEVEEVGATSSIYARHHVHLIIEERLPIDVMRA